MSSFNKNVVVGSFVILGLALLGFMIVRFGDAPAGWFTAPAFTVNLTSVRADGLSEGATIRYLGLSVGRVRKITLSPDQKTVLITASIDRQPALPSNVEGVISAPVFGATGLNLEVVGPAQPQGLLKEGDALAARYDGSALIPPEFRQLAGDLKLLSEQFRESHLIEHLDQTVVSTRVQVEKIGATLDKVSGIFADPKLRADISAATANFRQVTENAQELTKHLDELTKTVSADAGTITADAHELLTTTRKRMDEVGDQLAARLLQVSTVLDNINSASEKLQKGDGSMAMLLNDPKLYQNLADSARELNLGIQDMRRLVQQWEQEGVHLKLAK